MRLTKPSRAIYDATPDSQWLVVQRGRVVQSYPTRADCEYLVADEGGEIVHVSQVRWIEDVPRKEPAGQGTLF